MFSVPTVFIIGAGAGTEIDMPVGSVLSAEIAKKLNIKHKNHGQELQSGEPQLMEMLRQIARSKDELYEDWRRAGVDVAQGIAYTRSIDAYLNAHRDDEKIKVCGKLAIAQIILDHQRKCALYIEGAAGEFADRPKVEQSWLSDLLYLLQERIVKSENLDKIFDNLCIINFNYDRCIEQFLFNALQPLYRINQTDAAQLMQRLVIYHPYGEVGFMPWDNGNPKVNFGDTGYGDIVGLSGQIRTFNEQMEDKVELDAIRQRVANAGRIVFLGFHFHNQNMELLKASGPARGDRVHAYATAYDRSNADVTLIDEQIRHMLADRGGHRDIHVEKRDCKGLFKDYTATWLR
jgi:hypothetical protein